MEYEGRCSLTSIATLEEQGILTLSTGDEIGRLNYGTGDIPFVRTSDLGSFELKANSKQGISADVYDDFAAGQDTHPLDILLVRDGTYLVGSSSLVFEEDLPLLFCGGIYKLRCLDCKRLHAGLLYALLNTPFVRKQMRSKQFTRDVIDTLGKRVREVVLPIPKDSGKARGIAEYVESLCRTRVQLRSELRQLVNALQQVADGVRL